MQMVPLSEFLLDTHPPSKRSDRWGRSIGAAQSVRRVFESGMDGDHSVGANPSDAAAAQAAFACGQQLAQKMQPLYTNSDDGNVVAMGGRIWLSRLLLLTDPPVRTTSFLDHCSPTGTGNDGVGRSSNGWCLSSRSPP